MTQQNERVPASYAYVLRDDRHGKIELRSENTDEFRDESATFTFQVLGPRLFRTTFSSQEHPLPPYPSARPPAPQFNDSDRPFPRVERNDAAKLVGIRTPEVSAEVTYSHAPLVSLTLAGAKDPIHKDLPFRSYAVDGPGIAHYTAYKKDALHVGMGEKAAPMDLSSRSLLVAASDTFGYDAYRTDPLYKHIPLLINATPEGCVAIFSASHSRARWEVGSEIDGMWGHYKVYRQAYGGLDEYLIVGKTIEEVVKEYARLVGFPLLPPKYMMGYIGGGMKYSTLDDPRASDAVLNFIRQCEEHDIPCSAFQLSSGYTISETPPHNRHVFQWNNHRFPDSKAFTDECHRRGVRILANVKPYILDTHPDYERLVRAGAFFKDPRTGKAAVARLWSAGGGESGLGSHLDFTSQAAYNFWYAGVQGLRDAGIDAMWNDNNEYTLPDDAWECNLSVKTISVPPGLTRKDVGLWGRAMHTELNGQVSHVALRNKNRAERPFVLTRSATAGTMRWCASTWSGDNVTSWKSMQGGNALALNAAFSLISCYGHDTGGFEGPQPSPELLVRWIQLAVHSSRFAINCFKTSDEDNSIGDVIEPWMYPSVTAYIRKAMKRRYELVPYTYSLSIKAHLMAVPAMRWTGWGYESDPNVWTTEIKDGTTQYWFGDALLIAGVYEESTQQAKVYLPRGEDTKWGFLDLNVQDSYRVESLESGYWHIIPAPPQGSIPVLARIGSAIPIGTPNTSSIDNDIWRGVEIYPPPREEMRPGDKYTFCSHWYEDDGITAQEKTEMCLVRVEYVAEADAIEVKVVVEKQGGWTPRWCESEHVHVALPRAEKRKIRGAPEVGLKDGRPIFDVGIEVQTSEGSVEQLKSVAGTSEGIPETEVLAPFPVIPENVDEFVVV